MIAIMFILNIIVTLLPLGWFIYWVVLHHDDNLFALGLHQHFLLLYLAIRRCFYISEAGQTKIKANQNYLCLFCARPFFFQQKHFHHLGPWWMNKVHNQAESKELFFGFLVACFQGVIQYSFFFCFGFINGTKQTDPMNRILNILMDTWGSVQLSVWKKNKKSWLATLTCLRGQYMCHWGITCASGRFQVGCGGSLGSCVEDELA